MKFTVRKFDDDDPPHTEIAVADSSYAASQDSYISSAEFIEFARALQGFPQDRREALFTSGSRDSGWACFILLRAFERDMAGHAALEIEMTNHASGASFHSAHFFIWCEAAALNRLGHSLEAWARSDSQHFDFTDEGRDA